MYAHTLKMQCSSIVLVVFFQNLERKNISGRVNPPLLFSLSQQKTSTVLIFAAAGRGACGGGRLGGGRPRATNHKKTIIIIETSPPAASIRILNACGSATHTRSIIAGRLVACCFSSAVFCGGAASFFSPPLFCCARFRCSFVVNWFFLIPLLTSQICGGKK